MTTDGTAAVIASGDLLGGLAAYAFQIGGAPTTEAVNAEFNRVFEAHHPLRVHAELARIGGNDGLTLADMVFLTAALLANIAAAAMPVETRPHLVGHVLLAAGSAMNAHEAHGAAVAAGSAGGGPVAA